MTWTDQRPMAFAEADAPLAAPPQDESWRFEFELWSQPRPTERSMWSIVVWWWRRAVGVMVADAQGLRASRGRVPWGGLWQVQLEAWLLSDTYLELFVALKTRGEGVQAGVSAAFKVVLPHTWVSASVPVKQNAEVGYLDLEAFVEIWPLLCFYAQACDVHIRHLLGPVSLDGELPTWDVKDPAEVAVPGAGAGWWTRKKVDSWLNEYDSGAATSLEVPKHLWDLEQEGFDYLFGRLASWPKLTSFKIDVRCKSLKNVDGLAKLTNLTRIDLLWCSSLENVDGLANLTNLTYFNLYNCESLKNVDGLAKLTNLTRIDLRWCSSLKNVDVLARLTNLSTLDLSGCKSLESVDGLARLTKLTRVDLGWCSSLENVDGLAKLINITSLDLSVCDSLKNVDGLARLTKLTTLNLGSCKSLKNVDVLAKLPNLTELSLSCCDWLKSVDVLAKLPNLTTLDLRWCSSLENVDGLAKLTKLTTLDLSSCSSLENVDGLSKLINLTSLTLFGCKSLKNVDGLARLTKLTTLDLSKCLSLPARDQRSWEGDEVQVFLKSLRES